MFSAYRQRRIDGLLDYVLDEVNKGLLGAADAPSQPNVLGRRTRDWLKSVWRNADQAWEGLIPRDFAPEGRDLEAAPPSWIWGKYAVEVIASLVLDLLRRTQRLLHVSPESTMDLSLGDIASEMADPTPGGDEGDSYDWDVLDELDRNRRGHEGPLRETAPGRLAELWTRAYAVIEDASFSRMDGSEQIRTLAPRLTGLLATADEVPAAFDSLALEFRAWLTECLAPAVDAVESNGALARRLVDVLIDLRRQ